MFVRDELAPFVGEPEITLLDQDISVETIERDLVSGGLGTPNHVADEYSKILESKIHESSDAVKCAIDLLLGYFGSFRRAKLAIGTSSEDVVDTIAGQLMYSARQLALLYCSGTKKVEKYAN